MKERKGFCETCREDVECILTEECTADTIRGETYEYRMLEARCPKCGSYVSLPGLDDHNLEALYSVYREKNNIISLETLRSIPEKYAIGKRPLSVLLGWGEQTFTRYYDGDIPTRQYSDILKKIAEDVSYFAQILESNKSLLSSEQTYTKSRRAVDTLLALQDNACEKLDLVISYLLNQCQDITPLALQKALYYAQGFFYAFFGSFLFPEDCQAWAHGPVYRNIYARYADYHFDPITKVKEFDSSVFSAQEKAILDSIIKNFCCYSGKVLERFTHNERPWLATRGNLSLSEPSEAIIEKSLIGNYFREIKEKYSMVNPGDISAYAKDMFASL